MDDTMKLYLKHTMTLNIHFFSYFIAVIFLTMSHSSSAELEIISWQDLAPEYDGSMGLDDVPWGERVRPEMNEKIVRIPGFIVPLDFEQRQSVTRFLLVPYFGACIQEIMRDLTEGQIEAMVNEKYGTPDLNRVLKYAMKKIPKEYQQLLKMEEDSLRLDETELLDGSVRCSFNKLDVHAIS